MACWLSSIYLIGFWIIHMTNKYLEPQCWRLSINIMLEIPAAFLSQSAFGE